MLDMYDFNNDIWLCHSFGGKCYDFTSFVSIINMVQKSLVIWMVKIIFPLTCNLLKDFECQPIYYPMQQPAVNVLKEIRAFLEANPSEIITIFIEDYVASSQGLTNVFKAAGLDKYRFPLSRMPKNGGDWPTVDDMAQKNQRLVVFTSKSSKEAAEGIAYEWNYVVENQCEFCSLLFTQCLSFFW